MGHQVIGMEDYVSEGMRPLSRCLDDVDACDAYVGIFAWRYGSIPKDTENPGRSLPKQTTLGTTSITEFELREAIEKGKSVMVFLLDGDVAWTPAYLDAVNGEGEQGKAILRLR